MNIRIAYLNRVVEKYNLVTDADFRYVPRVAIDGTAISTGNENRDGDKTDTSGASGGVAVTERIPTAGEISFIWNGASRYEKTSGDESSHENVDSNSWKVALRQPLLKGAGLDYDMGMVRQAEITNQKNILSLKQTLIDELSSALTLYRSLLAAKYAMEISESSLEIANKNLEKAKVEVSYGRIPAMDIIQFESDVANRELSLEQSRNLYINARLALAKHLELDKSVLIIPSETLAITDVELDERESYQLALENRPAYLNDNLSIEVAGDNSHAGPIGISCPSSISRAATARIGSTGPTAAQAGNRPRLVRGTGAVHPDLRYGAPRTDPGRAHGEKGPAGGSDQSSKAKGRHRRRCDGQDPRDHDQATHREAGPTRPHTGPGQTQRAGGENAVGQVLGL